MLAAFGLKVDELDDSFQVWDCNWPAFQVFEAMGTQWRTGMGGAIGLDYAAIPAVFKLLGVKKKDRPALFDDVRIMESEALAVMAEQKRESSNGQ